MNLPQRAPLGRAILVIGVMVHALAASSDAPSRPASDEARGLEPAGDAAPEAGLPADGVIRFLERRVRDDPDDVLAQNRLAVEYLAAMRRGGDLRFLEKARGAAEASLRALPAELNVAGLRARARVEYESHDFAAARDSARRLVELAPRNATSYELLGNALLELGDYAAAGEAYDRMRRLAPDAADTHARLAHIRGDEGAARRHLEAALAAARELSPPSEEAVAWCLVKLGETSFNAGDWAAAERHYREALRVLPDGFAAAEHLGEVRAAQKRYDEAVSLYEDVVRRVPRPEFFHALGDVCRAAGRANEAKAWHAQALESYLRSAEAGVAHYYHHLAGYYCDVEPDAGRALHWALKDLEVRRSVHAHDAHARARSTSPGVFPRRPRRRTARWRRGRVTRTCCTTPAWCTSVRATRPGPRSASIGPQRPTRSSPSSTCIGDGPRADKPTRQLKMARQL